ncbi:hypothetical protein SteCoe_37869 [Stentor coeruleus]|uniref:Uncharacterized protein n=1 Tax=Stentor coeruleus TaxID=5963 RepID=A0A1R2AMA0_9CILI|nr:hypothetical protein SteCoe_37869 [Stentor coeruleus]
MGDDDLDFILPTTISVIASSSSGITSTTSTAVPSGSVTVSSSITGTYSFEIATTSSTVKSTSMSITFLVPKLVLTLSVTPALSSTPFNIDVNLKDNANSNVLTGSGTLTVSLVIACSSTSASTCSGLVTDTPLSTVELTSGHGTISSIKILSSGKFDLSATYSTWTSIPATTNEITNLIKSLVFNIPSSPIYTYENFDISVTITGEDNHDFILSCTLILSDNSIDKFNGKKDLVSNLALRTYLDMYYTGDGTFTIRGDIIEYPFSNTVSYTIIASVIEMIITDTPTDSLIAFTVTARTKHTLEGALITLNGPFTISLALVASGTGQSGSVWTCVSTQDTNSGEATFSNLQIKSSGSFYIIASSPGFANRQSDVFTITNYVKTIIASSTVTSSNLLISITINYLLKGDDDLNYILPTTVSVVATPSTGIISTTSTIVPSGSVTASSLNDGTYSLEVATTSNSVKSASISVDFLAPYLLVTLSQTPSLSTTIFDINVEIKNNVNIELFANSATLTVNLVIACSITSTCSGLVTSPPLSTLVLTSEKGTLSSVKILSSGKFDISATYSTWITTPATTNEITNLISFLIFTVPSSPIYTYDNFDITVTIKGEDNNNFILSCTLTLSDNSVDKFQGTKVLTSSEAVKTFSSMHYTGDGAFTIRCDITDNSLYNTVAVTITASIIELTFIDTPSDSSIAFTVTSQTKQTLGGTLITSNSPLTIALALVTSGTGQSGSVWTYTSTQDTFLGEAIFRSLNIKSSGNFYIVASSPGFAYSASSIFTITNHVKTIIANSYVTSIDIFTPITITYSLKGDDDQDFLLLTTVSIVASPQTGILSTTSSVVPSDSVTLSSSVPGTYSFEIVTTSNSIKSTSMSITFLVPNIVLTLSVTPALSSTPFDIYVNLKNNANNAILSNSGILSVNLVIECSSTSICSGLVTNTPLSTIELTSGYGTISSIRILSSGKFDLSATYFTWTSTHAITNEITNLISALVFAIPPSPIYTYDNFDITVTVTGEDNRDFILQCTITLSDNSVDKFQGTKVSVSNSATNFFSNMYYTGDGTFTIRGDITEFPFYNTASVTITASVIELTFTNTVISTYPTDSLVAFIITANIKKTLGGTIITSNSPFTIALALIASGTGQSGSVWTYASAQDTSSGETIFSNLQIKSSGSFYIVASSPGFANRQSDVFTITNHVKTITASSTITSVDIFTPFIITYSLKGDDDLDFLLSTTVSVVASSSLGIISTTSTVVPNGSVTVTSSIPDTYSFEIATTSSNIKSASISITFLVPKLVLTLSVVPALSSTPFDIVVNLKNNANTAILLY